MILQSCKSRYSVYVYYGVEKNLKMKNWWNSLADVTFMNLISLSPQPNLWADCNLKYTNV